MDAITSTSKAQAAEPVEPVQQRTPAEKPAEAPPAPKRDRAEVSDEAKARLAAEEQERTRSDQREAQRDQGQQNARTEAAVQALGLR